MEEIRDIKGRLVCYCNSATGSLESAYKKQFIMVQMPLGGKIMFVRDGIATNIIRRTPSQFYVYSQLCEEVKMHS